MSKKTAVEVTLQGEGEIPWVALHVVELEGVEGISQLFRFTLTLYSAEEIDPAAPLAEAVTVTLRHSDELVRHVNGVVAEFAFLRTISNLKSADGGPMYVYRATVAPRAWRLNLASNCRIFRAKAVTAILKEVLEANSLKAGADFAIPVRDDKALAWPGGPRDQDGFRVQYHETDWNFVARVMEEFGLFFYFTHTANGHQLRLGDLTEHYGKGEPARLALGEQLSSLQITAAMAPEAARLSDFNPARPSLDLSHVAGNAGSKLQLYEPFAGARESGQLSDLADLRLEEARAGVLRAEGESGCVGLLPGHVHELIGAADHPAAAGEFMVTRVWHHAVNSAPNDRYAEHSLGYDNSFTGIPAETLFRPPRVTPRPTVRGVQTAMVVGQRDGHPDLDANGRVLVRFHWSGDESCRLRVGQAVASGPGRGNKRYPRVGDEVLVHFHNGDPDRPVLLGAVYQPSDEEGVSYLPAVKGGLKT